MATTARNCGNIWSNSSAIRPTRRPVKRSRENANAASIDTKTPAKADSPAISTELRYQCPNAVVVNRSVKLPSPAPVGYSCVEDSEPTGLIAAEITNTIGNNEKTTHSTPTRCRQPTLRNDIPNSFTSTPPPAAGCGGS